MIRGEWIWVKRDAKGRVVDRGVTPNMWHDQGEEEMLRVFFGVNDGDYPQVELFDGAFVSSTRKLTDNDTGSAFSNVEALDYVYLMGGYEAGGQSLCGQYIHVASQSTDNVIVLSTDPYQTDGATALTNDITGGICSPPFYARRGGYYVGLDNRNPANSQVAEADTLTTVSSYEEDGGGYARVSVDPDTSGSWTFAQNSSNDWYALSKSVTFTDNGDDDWNSPNYNVFLCTVSSGTTGLLLSTASFASGLTIGGGESWAGQYRVTLTE